MSLLRAWDRRAATSSAATTLFVAWHDWIERDYPFTALAALDSAMAGLTTAYGSWSIPWGEVNRLQRWRDPGGSAADSLPSVAVPGVGGFDGAVFTFNTRPFPGLRRRYGVAGGTYVSVVEFGPQVRARTVHTFGASGDPASPHFFDQAPLYAGAVQAELVHDGGDQGESGASVSSGRGVKCRCRRSVNLGSVGFRWDVYACPEPCEGATRTSADV